MFFCGVITACQWSFSTGSKLKPRNILFGNLKTFCLETSQIVRASFTLFHTLSVESHNGEEIKFWQRSWIQPCCKPGQSTSKDLPHIVRQKRRMRSPVHDWRHTHQQPLTGQNWKSGNATWHLQLVMKHNSLGRTKKSRPLLCYRPLVLFFGRKMRSKHQGALPKGTLNVLAPDNSSCPDDMHYGAHRLN